MKPYKIIRQSGGFTNYNIVSREGDTSLGQVWKDCEGWWYYSRPGPYETQEEAADAVWAVSAWKATPGGSKP